VTSGSRRARRGAIATVVVLGLVIVGVFAGVGRGSAPALPTADVVKGEFVDALEIRGEIRPVKSIVMSAPLQSGELQIVTLARSGAMVKPGDVLVEFDASTLRRTIQEKQSELKQAEAEIEQAAAQAKITREQNSTALMKAKYDIERAKLDVQRGDTVSRIENEQARLGLADAEQRLRELEARLKSDDASIEADRAAKQRKREKALFDLQRAERGAQNLQLTAPAAGMVNVLPNYRASGPFSAEQEFRQGDRAWPGAAVIELPDLSSVHLEARLDESDRGRLRAGQDAVIRIEAIPGREFKARINSISVLARVDFSSGWPPARNFDLNLVLVEVDPKIRPGMSAVARIATDRLPDVVLVPAQAVFQRDGHPVVYRLDRTQFIEQRVEISRRGREQAIVTSGVSPGDRIAIRRPGPELIRRSE
jgi:RND family efflux transporter MFP subunit